MAFPAGTIDVDGVVKQMSSGLLTRHAGEPIGGPA